MFGDFDMTIKRRSELQFTGLERSLQRAWAKGAGLIDEEFERPMIAVVNTYQDFSPENFHLRQVSEAVCAGVRMAGGTPCMFNTFHVTDLETFASVGMRYVLPSRDVVADMIELMVEGHRFDAMVLIGSGDKVMPGMVMAAARIDLPSIIIYGGPTPVGRYRGKKVFLETVYDAVGEHIRGERSLEDLKGLEDNHFPFSGACDTATSGNPRASTLRRWVSPCRIPARYRLVRTISCAPQNIPACASWTCCATMCAPRRS